MSITYYLLVTLSNRMLFKTDNCSIWEADWMKEKMDKEKQNGERFLKKRNKEGQKWNKNKIHSTVSFCRYQNYLLDAESRTRKEEIQIHIIQHLGNKVLLIIAKVIWNETISQEITNSNDQENLGLVFWYVLNDCVPQKINILKS